MKVWLYQPTAPVKKLWRSSTRSSNMIKLLESYLINRVRCCFAMSCRGLTWRILKIFKCTSISHHFGSEGIRLPKQWRNLFKTLHAMVTRLTDSKADFCQATDGAIWRNMFVVFCCAVSHTCSWLWVTEFAQQKLVEDHGCCDFAHEVEVDSCCPDPLKSLVS